MKYGVLAALACLVPLDAAWAQQPVSHQPAAQTLTDRVIITADPALTWNHVGYSGNALSAWAAIPAAPESLPSVEIATLERLTSGPALARAVQFETDCTNKTARTLLLTSYGPTFVRTGETALPRSKHQPFVDLGPAGSVLTRYCTGPSRQTLLGDTSDALKWLEGTALRPAVTEPTQMQGGADLTYLWKVREIGYGRAMAWATGETAGMKLFFVANRHAEQQQADGESHTLWGTLDTYQLNCTDSSAQRATIRNFDRTGAPAGFILASGSVAFAELGVLEPAMAEACGVGKAQGYATMTNWGGVQTWLADLMVRTAKTYPLPAVVKVREAIAGIEAGGLEATWTRRGKSNLYDGVWVDLITGETSTDVLEWRSIDKGKLTVYRAGKMATYTIPVTDRVAGPGRVSSSIDPAFYAEFLPNQP